MSDRTFVDPSGISPPRSAYRHAVRARGEVLWLAGQVPIDEEGKTVGVGDVAAQLAQVMHNIERILGAAGAGWSQVVRLVILCVGKENVAPLREARTGLWARLYPDGDYPSATFIVVEGLASEEFLVEVEATAVVA